MYFSKNLEWLREYYNLVKPIYPKLKKLKKVTIIKSSTTTRDRAYGLMYPLDNGYFSISLRTQYQYIDFNPLTIKLKPFSKIDLINNFAHELAHAYHFYHTPEHGILECQIRTIFHMHLKLTGYISEEDELGGVQ